MQAPTRLSLVLLLSLVGSAHRTAQAGSIEVDAGRGPVTVQVPSSYDPQEPMPLVMLLHGYGSSGSVTESYFGLLPLSEQHGFIYVYPNGTVDGNGNRYWNATNACCDFYNTGIDDAGYLRALIDEIKGALTVDSRRVYIAGHSNGGFMAHRMACEHADSIAAIASLAGATWATYDGCTLVEDTSAPNLDLVANLAGAETSVTRWIDSCAQGGSAELWTLTGAPHVPSFNSNFRAQVVEYFLAHPKPGLGATYCAANGNSSGAAAMILASGSTSLTNNDLVLSATSVPAGMYGIFFYGALVDSLPLGNGVLCIGGGGTGLFRLPVVNSGATGVLQHALDLLSPSNPAGLIQAGSTWKFQAWFRDTPAGGSQFNLSDAVSLEFDL